MPIEFNCPSCAKLLRTPDESAGKKAKCPQCGTITTVPGGPPPAEPWTSAPLTSALGPMTSDSPFGTGSSAPPPKPSPFSDSASTNPYAAPAPSAAGMTAEGEELPRIGLPWERQEKSAKSFWETSKMILGSPTLAFSLMFREGGLGTPIVYLLIGGAIGGVLAGTYQTLMQLVILFAAGAGNQGGFPAGFEWIQVAIQLPIQLAAGTIGILIGSFISAGIYHLCLMMLGGARYPFETTYRVIAYVNGAAALLNVIPFCGQYALGLIALIYTIIGLSNAHRIGGGKAAAAVLLPMVVCVIACGLIVAAIAGFAVTAARQG